MASRPGRDWPALGKRDDPTSTTTAATSPTTALSAVSPTSSPPGLPSTTIVALGLCFVAAALFVVLLTILARVHQVRRMTRAAQATGEDVDFSRMWTQQGGWLGYLMTAGDSLGAHGMWEGQNRATRYRKVPIPRIWEADVAKDPSAEELDWDKDQPLAVVPAPTKKAPDDIAVSFLVRMPSEDTEGEKRISHYDDDDEGELPYLMLGTTFVVPSSSLAAAGVKPGALDEANKDVVELEYVPRRLPIAPPYAARSAWSDAFALDIAGIRR